MKLVQHSGSSELNSTIQKQNSIVEARVQEKLDEVLPSAARLRFQELTANKPKLAPVEKVTLESGDWFIRRMNFPQFTRFGLLTPRDENDLLDLEDSENLTKLTAAMLYCCVATDESGEVDFFSSRPEAYIWANETEPVIRNVVAELFNVILEFNPDIIADEDTEDATLTSEEKKVLEKKERSGSKRKSRKKASSTPLTTSDATGGTPTPCTEEPPTSATDTSDQQDTIATLRAT